MEIIIVVLLLLIIAALVYAFMKFRPEGRGSAGGLQGHTDGVRGSRRTAVAARHDPMAEAVERHSMATDPHEAAEAELRLQAQANRVASDLHARQASALESEVHGTGAGGHAVPANDYAQPPNNYAQPPNDYAQPPNDYAQPPNDYAQPPHADGRPVYEDEHGRPVYEDGRPVHRDEPPRY